MLSISSCSFLYRMVDSVKSRCTGKNGCEFRIICGGKADGDLIASNLVLEDFDLRTEASLGFLEGVLLRTCEHHIAAPRQVYEQMMLQ
jgi:hypothetical protein